MNTPITVVIPARNAKQTLKAQLEALAAQEPGPVFSVVLVDNGSTDGTGDLARSFSTERFDVMVVREEAAGINNARNAGIAASQDGAILLCDADDVVGPGWVGALSGALQDGHWVAGVVDYLQLNSPLTVRQWGAPDRSACDEPDPFVDRTFGCNCGFSKSMWADVGRFDPGLSGVGGDETEFFMRAFAKGWRRRWVPDAVVAYRLRPGLRNMCRQRYRQGKTQVRMALRPGGQIGVSIPSVSGSLGALSKLLLVSPLYAWVPSKRYAWLAAVSRVLGRLRGYASGEWRHRRGVRS